MQHKLLFFIERYNTKYLPKILTVLLLASLALSACGKKPSETYSSTSIPEPSQNTSTQAEPVTLEQALLKERGKPYDQSDYKTFVGGEGIINEYAEFDCNLDHGYSKTVNDLVVADGKLYQANFNSVLANGKNIQEVGTLPGKNIRYWRLTHDGEMGEIYLNDGSGYKVSNPPFTASPMDNRQYVIFAVYEVLDKNGAEYEKTDASTILAEMSVYGNLSRFSVSVNEQETGTELTVTMIHPCQGLSDTGMWVLTDLTMTPEAGGTTPSEKCTVTYTDGVDNEEIFKDQTYTVESGKATPAFNGTPTRKGYTFVGWKPAVAATVTGNATYGQLGSPTLQRQRRAITSRALAKQQARRPAIPAILFCGLRCCSSAAVHWPVLW